MFSVRKSFVAYFLMCAVGLLVIGYWFEFYWTVYLVFTLLVGCLIFGAKETSKSELRRLSDLDFVLRVLESVLLVVLLGLAIRSGERTVQVFCVTVFILYHFVYLKAIPKEVRSESFGRN